MTEPLVGIPAGTLPRDSAALDGYMRAQLAGGRITVTDTSRRLASHLLSPHTILFRPAFHFLRLLTIGTLPPQIRDAYGFRWEARELRAFERWVRMVRGVIRWTPPVLRQWPQAWRRATGHRAISVITRHPEAPSRTHSTRDNAEGTRG